MFQVIRLLLMFYYVLTIRWLYINLQLTLNINFCMCLSYLVSGENYYMATAHWKNGMNQKLCVMEVVKITAK